MPYERKENRIKSKASFLALNYGNLRMYTISYIHEVIRNKNKTTELELAA